MLLVACKFYPLFPKIRNKGREEQEERENTDELTYNHCSFLFGMTSCPPDMHPCLYFEILWMEIACHVTDIIYHDQHLSSLALWCGKRFDSH